jgi:hypothetical protein
MAQRVQTVKKLKDSLENYLSLSGMYEQARNTYYMWVYAASKVRTTNSSTLVAVKDVLAGYEDVFSQKLIASSYYSHQTLSINQLHNLTYYKFLQEAEDHIYNLFRYSYGIEELINFDIAEFMFDRVLSSELPLLAAYTVLHLIHSGTNLFKTLGDVRRKQLYLIKKRRKQQYDRQD